MLVHSVPTTAADVGAGGDTTVNDGRSVGEKVGDKEGATATRSVVGDVVGLQATVPVVEKWVPGSMSHTELSSSSSSMSCVQTVLNSIVPSSIAAHCASPASRKAIDVSDRVPEPGSTRRDGHRGTAQATIDRFRGYVFISQKMRDLTAPCKKLVHRVATREEEYPLIDDRPHVRVHAHAVRRPRFDGSDTPCVEPTPDKRPTIDARNNEVINLE